MTIAPVSSNLRTEGKTVFEKRQRHDDVEDFHPIPTGIKHALTVSSHPLPSPVHTPRCLDLVLSLPRLSRLVVVDHHAVSP
ncbi:hypothetical protein ACG7TL_005956 [Trametes sanguinea]